MRNKIISILCVLAMLLPLFSFSVTAADSTESIQKTVYNFLTKKLSLCPAAAAGIMGNVMIECGFDPNLEVIDTNDKPSYGLMMWNGPRYESLKEWCKKHGYKKSDPMGQLTYLKWELENTEKAAYALMKNIPNTIEGACQAAILWASDFERCTRTSFGLRVYYALNTYWPKYAGGTSSKTQGIFGYYYNVPENIKYGEALTLYGAVVSYSSSLKSVTAGVYTESGELVTGKTITASNFVGNVGVIDRYVVFNKVPRGKYYYQISAENASGDYMVERHAFTVSNKKTTSTLITESKGGVVICPLGVACPSANFKDKLAPTHWAHDAVDYVLKNEFFLGNGAGKFQPKTNMSRAMAVTVLNRVVDHYGLKLTSQKEETPQVDTFVPEDDVSDITSALGGNVSVDVNVDTNLGTSPLKPPFLDVVKNSWYEDSVLWALEYGITNGKSEDAFEPNSDVSRGELAVMLYRIAKGSSVGTGTSVKLTSFADGKTVPAWAKEGLSWAVSNGIITGTERDGKMYLDYSANATREQVAAIIMRFAALIEN